MSQDLITSIDSRGVAKVIINRPDVHNAFNDALISEITTAFNDLGSNPEVRVIVLASNGKNFCAGADLNWMKSMADYDYQQNFADSQNLAAMFKAINTVNKPTIARIQGSAFGGGVGLAACCDMVVATKLSRFCLSEVKLGLIPATISPYVIAAMGARSARHLFLTAEMFSARRARRLGLVTEVVGEDSLDEEVEKLINSLLKNGPNAIATAKALVLDYENQPLNDQLIEDSCKRIAEIRVSDEGQEGLGAFLQKRKPNWQE